MKKDRRPLVGITGQYTRRTASPGSGQQVCEEHTVLAGYFDAVLQAGGLPLLIPATTDSGVTTDYLDRVAGVLFTGCRQDYPPAWYGEPDAPETVPMGSPRAESDRRLMTLALQGTKPLMGICAGIQLFNVCSGGGLIQQVQTSIRHTMLSPSEDACHEVAIRADSRLAGILQTGRCQVNSSHHQAVDRDRIAPGLKPAATASDGIVEALEPGDPSAPFRLFVQWHPERIDDATHRAKLFSAFVDACRRTPAHTGG